MYYGYGVMRRNVYSSAIFTGGRPLCTQILSNRVFPHQQFLATQNYTVSQKKFPPLNSQ